MHRIDHSTANATLPAPEAAGSPGYFKKGEVGASSATVVSADWANAMQEELAYVITQAGLALSKTDNTQLRQAILKMVQDSNSAVVITGAVFTAGVTNGEAVRWDSAQSKFTEAIADGTANNQAVGVADVTNSKVYCYGETPALFSGLTPGGKYYLSAATPGALTTIVAADAVSVGIAKSATVLFVDIDASPVNVAIINSTVFNKSNSTAQAFTKTGAGTISVLAGTSAMVAGTFVSFAADTAVVMPVLTAGTDYAIYFCTDGTARADANFSAPTGYTTANSRKIGGFHYDLGSAINQYSIWDLKWRPACPDPRGMVLVANHFWCDIYLCGTTPDVDGTSKYNVTIADGVSPPKIPSAFGGNGTTDYGSFTWFEASEVMNAFGKQLLSYADFAAAAYGVTEQISVGADPVTTKRTADYISKWGAEQATGNMWLWGRDSSFRPDGTAGWAWNANTEGRGSLYLQNTLGLVYVLLGGNWGNAADSGSRASNWSHCPWVSSSDIGARGRCDHLQLA